jgi:hypothetical protein
MYGSQLGEAYLSYTARGRDVRQRAVQAAKESHHSRRVPRGFSSLARLPGGVPRGFSSLASRAPASVTIEPKKTASD